MNQFLFHDSVVAALKSRIEEEKDHLGNGAAQDWGDCQRRIGRITGFKDALAIIEEVRVTLLGE